eukprot:UN19613
MVVVYFVIIFICAYARLNRTSFSFEIVKWGRYSVGVLDLYFPPVLYLLLLNILHCIAMGLSMCICSTIIVNGYISK